jgi:hypothetical protein
MTSVIILGLLAGALFIYGLPHLLMGAKGKDYPTPIGDNAMMNVFWGWLSWVVAVLLWHTAPMHFHPRAAFVGVAAGVLIMGWLMSRGTTTVRRRK